MRVKVKIKEWGVFLIFVAGLWAWQRMQRLPLVEVRERK